MNFVAYSPGGRWSPPDLSVDGDTASGTRAVRLSVKGIALTVHIRPE
jgi:hypothetical protein